MAVSRNGITPKMNSGPQNQKTPHPVSSTRPQAMNGSSGTRRPNNQA